MKVIEHVSTKGWVSLVKRAYEKAREFIFYFRREYLFTLQLQELSKESKQGVTFKVILAAGEDIKTLEEGSYKNAALFRKWFNNGSLLFCALDGDKIIGHLSMSPEPVDHWSACLNLKPKEIWGHDAFVLPDYRGMDILSYMIMEAVPVLMKRGYKQILSSISAGNIPSIKAHTKCGFKKAGEAKQLRILGVEKFWINRVCS